MKKPNLKQQYRVNEQIRGVRDVRIVGDDIESSVVSISKALQIAEQRGVDLVEISPNAEPPVCRLIDYSKFIYQQKKHQKEIKAKQVKEACSGLPQRRRQGEGLRLLQGPQHPLQGAGRSVAAAFCCRPGGIRQGRADAAARRQANDYVPCSEEAAERSQEASGNGRGRRGSCSREESASAESPQGIHRAEG